MVPAVVDIKAIRRQLEYYFSDSNLPRDKFLRAKTEENEHGFVPIPVLLTFKRLQNLGATPDNIVDAVKTSELLGLDENSDSLRRLTPLPDQSLFATRAIFAKGWKAGGPEPTIDDLIKLFEPSGKVLSVRIRRWVDEEGKHFKGSVFIEMESPEAVERVVAEEYSIDVKDDDGKDVEKQLLLMPVDEYFQQKREEKKNYIRKKFKVPMDRKGKGKDGDGRSEHTNDQNTKGKRTVKDENGQKAAKEEDGVVPDAESKPDTRTKSREIIPGLVLKFEGFGPDVSREDIREAFEPHGEIAWVDFRRGDSEGFIRLTTAHTAIIARDSMRESKTEFGGKLPAFSIVVGEAEEAYWKDVWQKKDMAVENNRKRRREGGRGGGRSGKRFRGGGRGSGGRGRGGARR